MVINAEQLAVGNEIREVSAHNKIRHYRVSKVEIGPARNRDVKVHIYGGGSRVYHRLDHIVLG